MYHLLNEILWWKNEFVEFNKVQWGILIQRIGYVGDGGTDKPIGLGGSSSTSRGNGRGRAYQEPRGHRVRQEEDSNKVGSDQRVLGPQRRGSLQSSCRYRKREHDCWREPPKPTETEKEKLLLLLLRVPFFLQSLPRAAQSQWTWEAVSSSSWEPDPVIQSRAGEQRKNWCENSKGGPRARCSSIWKLNHSKIAQLGC